MNQLFKFDYRSPPFYPFPLFFFIFGLDFELDCSPGPLPTVAFRTFIIVSTTMSPPPSSRMLRALVIASRVVYTHKASHHGLQPAIEQVYVKTIYFLCSHAYSTFSDAQATRKEPTKRTKKNELFVWCSVLTNVCVVRVTCEYVTCSTQNVSCQYVFTCLNVRILMCQKLKNPNTHI
jgi:hypothetical protein